MERKEIEEIDRKLSVFSFPRLNELITLANLLEAEGISLDRVREFVASVSQIHKINRDRFEKMAEERKRLWEKNTRRCPTCMGPLMLRPVTLPQGKENLKGYTCHWFCQKEDCIFEEYTKEDYPKLYRKILEV